MIKEQIEECIQKILDNELGGISADNCPKDGIEKYRYMTAFRLSKFVKMYRTRRISKDDLLISLRNYLLVFQTSVHLPEDIDIQDNPYGLRTDSEGLCYATLNLPDYMNTDIIKQGFMEDYIEPQKDERYFLGVTPNIYRLTGFKKFKSIRQKLAVNGALNMPEGYTALVSLPTGGGKSLITQTMAYQKKDGLTITVVPTVSLAMDQVRVAKDNIKVAMESEIACYYSDLSKEEKRSIIDRIKNRKLRLLFISPEALIKNEVFKQVIDVANDSGYLRNLIIDEAHIVIEWGNFFRVDYQCLEPWRNNLYEKNSKLKTVLLSATYEKNTVKILQSMFATGDKWIEIRCDALRREPRFELVTATSFRDKNEKTRELLRCLPRPMVVYVMRPDQAEKVKEMAAEIGITNVETFTGKTKADERSRIIDEWSENEFDIIVATSAFGVGVDKSDVRTVLHLYVPDNPNAYYQELGRGGRDGLPCLSVMCVYPDEDLESAFVMTDKVLGSDKILGRWDSMLNSHTSARGIDYCTLDTSVKPNYNSVDYAEDTSTVDQKWNIYVILILRRYNLIKILDMVVDPKTQVYFIRVSILDKRLLQITDQTKALIEEVRAKEWTKNEKDFKTMSRAVKQGKRMCWSEMFFNSTYSMVSEYCAGCDNHKNIVDSDPMRFELVKKVPAPTRKFSVELDNMFASSNEAILFSDIDNTELIGRVINRGFSTVIINDEEQSSYFNLLNSISEWMDVNLLGMNEFMRLVEHGDYYYFAGDAVVLYGNTEQDIYKKLRRLRKALGTREVRLLHVFREDIYCNEVNKTVSSIVDGPVIEEYLIERM
ncbi:MAG: helicase-related protein [Agathobacter sp.]|nr:helicase-related protein [Agathobacter sp.]